MRRRGGGDSPLRAEPPLQAGGAAAELGCRRQRGLPAILRRSGGTGGRHIGEAGRNAGAAMLGRSPRVAPRSRHLGKVEGPSRSPPGGGIR